MENDKVESQQPISVSDGWAADSGNKTSVEVDWSLENALEFHCPVTRALALNSRRHQNACSCDCNAIKLTGSDRSEKQAIFVK